MRPGKKVKIFFFLFPIFQIHFSKDFQIKFEFDFKPLNTKLQMQQHECSILFLPLYLILNL
jgi:hypothetical protein